MNPTRAELRALKEKRQRSEPTGKYREMRLQQEAEARAKREADLRDFEIHWPRVKEHFLKAAAPLTSESTDAEVLEVRGTWLWLRRTFDVIREQHNVWVGSKSPRVIDQARVDACFQEVTTGPFWKTYKRLEDKIRKRSDGYKKRKTQWDRSYYLRVTKPILAQKRFRRMSHEWFVKSCPCLTSYVAPSAQKETTSPLQPRR
jgi:hypothetical protein